MHFNGNGRVARHAATTKLFWPESTQGPQKAALERCFRARHKRQIDDQLIDLHAGMQRYNISGREQCRATSPECVLPDT